MKQLNTLLFGRLTGRLAAILFIATPCLLLLAAAINYVGTHVLGILPQTTVSDLMQIALLIIGLPLVLAWLIARYVTRPYEQLMKTIDHLKYSTYDTQVKPQGIAEIDTVGSAINNLSKRLKQEEALRKELIADASHEFGTPLMAISSELQLLKSGKTTFGQESLQTLQEQTDRLIGLVARLDEYTVARLPENFTTQTTIKVRGVCSRIIRHFEQEAAQQGITIALSVPKTLTLKAHAGTLEQIITNLIQNALRYSGGKKITITANASQIMVTDDGKGVDKAHLSRLFDRFYRVEKSRNRTFGGLGLGLAIVQELVTRNGWKIEVKNGYTGLQIIICFSY